MEANPIAALRSAKLVYSANQTADRDREKNGILLAARSLLSATTTTTVTATSTAMEPTSVSPCELERHPSAMSYHYYDRPLRGLSRLVCSRQNKPNLTGVTLRLRRRDLGWQEGRIRFAQFAAGRQSASCASSLSTVLAAFEATWRPLSCPCEKLVSNRLHKCTQQQQQQQQSRFGRANTLNSEATLVCESQRRYSEQTSCS